MSEKPPIRIWPFHLAPEVWTNVFCMNSGDEDLVIVIPPEFRDDYPYQLDSLGCCHNCIYDIDEHGSVYYHRATDGMPQRLESRLPELAGCRVIIPCHA